MTSGADRRTLYRGWKAEPVTKGEPMRIAVFGTGGVGGFFGGRLARAGVDVAFVARGEHLRALRRDGLTIESVEGGFTVPVFATDDPAEIGEADFVLLATKTWQVEDAARRVLPILRADSAVVTTQNGVDAPALVAAVAGRERTLPGTVRVLSEVAGPGRIRHGGGNGSIAFAEWNDRPSARVDALRDAFRRAGLKVETPPSIEGALWAKFLFVVPLGGVGAVTRAPFGVIRSVAESRAMLEEAMAEIHRVALARGVPLPAGAVATTMTYVDALPPGGTSSLQRDLIDGRPSELEAWSGAVVRLAAEAGVAAPVHRFIHAALLPQERRARGELAFG